MYALWHAEYLVFMHTEVIRDSYLPKFGLLRNPKRSGLPLDTNLVQIGALPKGDPSFSSYDSFQEAVHYVYVLFGQMEVDEFLRPESTSIDIPDCSVALNHKEMKDIKAKFNSIVKGEVASSREERKMTQLKRYVGKLWEKCITEQESTFAALHAFSIYWVDDIGNDANKGWYGFPLEAINRKGDMISWFVVWRQVWYMAIVSEFLHVSPIIASAFISSVLQ